MFVLDTERSDLCKWYGKLMVQELRRPVKQWGKVMKGAYCSNRMILTVSRDYLKTENRYSLWIPMFFLN